MSEPTLQQLLSAGLKSEGWKETDSSAKYRVFVRPGQRMKFFVGANGALRRGHTRSATHSIGDSSNRTAVWQAIHDAGARVLKVDGNKVRAHIDLLKAAGKREGDVPQETPMDAIERTFDTVPCDTNIPDDEGVSRAEGDVNG